MGNLRTNFVYYLTAVIAIFGITALCSSLFTSFSPAADNAANKPIEFDLSSLAEGEHVRLNIYGSPVFIRHRSPEDIKAAQASYHSARYPERDEDRLLAYNGQKDPRYIILKGNSGPWCYVTPNFGDYKEQGGWSCVARGSHFDGSGRVQKGPDMNLEIPYNARLSSRTTVKFLKSK